MGWLRHLFGLTSHEEKGPDNINQVDEMSPNIRALRLTMSIADVLLSMGVATSDVVSLGQDVIRRYCKHPAQLDISSTIITLSQDRGDDREPLTLIRAIKLRYTNNMTVQTLQQFVRDIRRGDYTLSQAEETFDSIMHRPIEHSMLVTTISNALISAGVALLYTGSPIIIGISFFIGAGVSFALRRLANRRFPAFYSQVVASIIITLIAASIAWLGNHGVAALANVNPTLIVIGGIVMLVAGLAVVGAVQDAIDEYYVTANAKILRVIMMTIGIVAGVLIGLYIARLANVEITLAPNRLGVRETAWQYVGAAIIAAGYALSNHSRLVGVLFAGFLGWVAIFCYSLCIDASLSIIAASAIASIVIGILATLFSRIWSVPSFAMIAAGIIPLVPGVTLYNGLMQIVNAQNNAWALNDGMATLFTALLIALAIAAGASFGMIIGRPLRRTLSQRYNQLPNHPLSRN